MSYEQQDSATSLGIRLRMGMALVFGMAMLATAFPASAIHAQTLTVLHGFSGANDGGLPYDGLTVDSAGNFYGTASGGGTAGYGVVYKLTRSAGGWRYSTIYDFKGGYDGAYPTASPIFGPDGALYGTTSAGGGGGCSDGCGTVYRLAPNATACKNVLCEGTEMVLYRAAPDKGELLYGRVLFDQAGNIYSTVAVGGKNDGGYVFELTPSGGYWTSQVIYAFNPDDGDCDNPRAGLVWDSAGNLYGTANEGCIQNGGGVFELTLSGQAWKETIVRAFDGRTDGENPYAPLTPDGHGDFYGVNFGEGPQGGGTVFELTPSGQGWMFSVVWGFSTSNDDGNYPFAAVSVDAAGNLYGTTFECAGFDGTIFKLTPSSNGWSQTVLYRFLDGDDGGTPQGNVVMDAQGNLYGTTSQGGVDENGVVWELTP